MRYMGLLKGNQQSENFVPTPDDFARMGQYIDQAMKAGWLIATDGLQSSSKASRIQVADGKRTVTDGPFTEAKELIASYAILEVGSKDEAIERTTEFLNLIGGGEIDLYRIYEPSDFAQERRAAMALLTRPKAGYAPANGLRMYYEIHGTGEPLILLHGGFGSTGMFGEVRSLLAASHQVIAVDLQGHGRTADIDRPLRFEDMADDVAALLAFLGIAQADFMGYSL
ncbi:MAG: alpha/beta fold hydrolase, partial [Chloroflexota bacterium]|nr:alpha/beta fold hydrolase [Chloroflexota bacterium]